MHIFHFAFEMRLLFRIIFREYIRIPTLKKKVYRMHGHLKTTRETNGEVSKRRREILLRLLTDSKIVLRGY